MITVVYQVRPLGWNVKIWHLLFFECLSKLLEHVIITVEYDLTTGSSIFLLVDHHQLNSLVEFITFKVFMYPEIVETKNLKSK